MLECVHAHIRTDKSSNITQFYQRLAKKKGNSKAAVAAASKLLRVVYWVMKERREYQGDVSNLSTDKLYTTVKQQKDRIDILFANAGLWEFVRLEAITEAHFDKIFNVNVKGLLFTVQKALPLFQDGGSIILMASIGGSKGFEGLSVYHATKAAIRSQTSQNPGQRYQSWSNRASWPKTRFAEHARCREIND